MKTIITEAKLNKLISESIKRVLVNEGFFDSMYVPEASKTDDSQNDSKNKNKDKENTGSKKRQRVVSRLKDPGVDVAQYAYQLWPDKDEDSARSYFYKCLNGEKNDSGVPYKFSDDEVNRLYSLLSNDSL